MYNRLENRNEGTHNESVQFFSTNISLHRIFLERWEPKWGFLTFCFVRRIAGIPGWSSLKESGPLPSYTGISFSWCTLLEGEDLTSVSHNSHKAPRNRLQLVEIPPYIFYIANYNSLNMEGI